MNCETKLTNFAKHRLCKRCEVNDNYQPTTGLVKVIFGGVAKAVSSTTL